MGETAGSNSKFTIFPAIDLRNGQVVRLRHGDPGQMRVYGDDPIAVANNWIASGSEWLHVVNLDGAFDETGAANWVALAGLAKLGVKIQFGGGLRTLPDMERALDLGVSRLILGTAALEEPDLIHGALTRFGSDTIVAGIDARDGWVKTHGWTRETGVTGVELGHQMNALGIRMAVYTDIRRDGDLTGPNLDATAQLAQETGLQVIASGGVSSLADVLETRRLAPAGIAGIIIGRALYDGRVNLAEAIRAVAMRQGGPR